MRESTHHESSDGMTPALGLRRQDLCFSEPFNRHSKISVESPPFDRYDATLRCVLPGGPGKINQGGFGLAARKAAQSFRDEDSLFIVFEEFREFYPTFGRTDVTARTSSLFLDGHGEAASTPWRALPIPPIPTSACMCFRQRSTSLHAARQRDMKAGFRAVMHNRLSNAVTFDRSWPNDATQAVRTATDAARGYAVWLIAAMQLRPAHSSRSTRPIQSYSLLILLSFFDATHAAPSNQVNQQQDWDKLSGMRAWDGIPYNEFRLEWFNRLMVSLGSIVQDGWTLLQTARNQDLGSAGNPGTPAQTSQSLNRNARLFACLMNYIFATCALYRLAQSDFNNDGRALYNYIWVYGHLAYTPDQTARMQAEWDEATISKAKIEYDAQAPFKWAEYIHDLGDKLGKTHGEKRSKFLRGFPESFNVITMPESLSAGNGNYVFPVNYPPHHPKAGNAHPNAGEPDIDAMARAFVRPWLTMITKGSIKRAPEGMAREAFSIELSSSEDESGPSENAFAVNRSKIDANFICLACGGRGHAAQVDGQTCLTKLLGISVPQSELAKTQYPNGLAYPGRRGGPSDSQSRERVVRRFKRYAKRMAKLSETDEEVSAVIKRFNNKRTQRSAKQAEAKQERPHLLSSSSSEASDGEEEVNKVSETGNQVMAVTFDDIIVQ